jgi:hypothetical protein
LKITGIIKYPLGNIIPEDLSSISISKLKVKGSKEEYIFPPAFIYPIGKVSTEQHNRQSQQLI